MLHIIVKLLGAIIILLGVILVYDARVFVKEYFRNENQNDYSKKAKILGTILSICGGIIIMCA